MDKSVLVIVASLTLVIGVMIGAIGAAVLLPAKTTVVQSPAPAPQLSEPTRALVQEVAKSFSKYPGSTLIDLPPNIDADDARVIRDYLLKNTNSGTWSEVEWTRVDPNADESNRFYGLGLSGKSYGIDLSYRIQSPFGGAVLHGIHVLFHKDGRIMASGHTVGRDTWTDLKR